MTKTHPIRITEDVYEKVMELMTSERERGTSLAKAYTRTDTNWFSEIMERGITAYLHDTKQDRK